MKTVKRKFKITIISLFKRDWDKFNPTGRMNARKKGLVDSLRLPKTLLRSRTPRKMAINHV
jgi:hypothetical protein